MICFELMPPNVYTSVNCNNVENIRGVLQREMAANKITKVQHPVIFCNPTDIDRLKPDETLSQSQVHLVHVDHNSTDEDILREVKHALGVVHHAKPNEITEEEPLQTEDVKEELPRGPPPAYTESLFVDHTISMHIEHESRL